MSTIMKIQKKSKKIKIHKKNSKFKMKNRKRMIFDAKIIVKSHHPWNVSLCLFILILGVNVNTTFRNKVRGGAQVGG